MIGVYALFMGIIAFLLTWVASVTVIGQVREPSAYQSLTVS